MYLPLIVIIVFIVITIIITSTLNILDLLYPPFTFQHACHQYVLVTLILMNSIYHNDDI